MSVNQSSMKGLLESLLQRLVFTKMTALSYAVSHNDDAAPKCIMLSSYRNVKREDSQLSVCHVLDACYMRSFLPESRSSLTGFSNIHKYGRQSILLFYHKARQFYQMENPYSWLYWLGMNHFPICELVRHSAPLPMTKSSASTSTL